jgi:hypothetical protein
MDLGAALPKTTGTLLAQAPAAHDDAPAALEPQADGIITSHD